MPNSSLVSVTERNRVDVAGALQGGEHPDRRSEIDHDESTIVVLSTYDNTRRDTLGCGEVLSDALLEATLVGLATCTLTHMTELEASRDIVRALTEADDRLEPMHLRAEIFVLAGVAPIHC